MVLKNVLYPSELEMDIEVADAIKIGLLRNESGVGYSVHAQNYNPLGPVDMLFKFKDKDHIAEVHRVAGPREILSSVPLTLSEDEDFVITFTHDGQNYLVEGSVYPYDGAVPITLTLKVTKFL